MKVLGSNLLGTQHTERSPVLSLYEPGPGNQLCGPEVASFATNDEVSEAWDCPMMNMGVYLVPGVTTAYMKNLVCGVRQKDACDLYVEGQIRQEVSRAT